METLKKIFPLSFMAKDNNGFVVNLVIYVVVGVVAGLILGLLGKIPLIGFLFSLIGSLISLYVVIGIVLAVLDFLKIIK